MAHGGQHPNPDLGFLFSRLSGCVVYIQRRFGSVNYSPQQPENAPNEKAHDLRRSCWTLSSKVAGMDSLANRHCVWIFLGSFFALAIGA